MKNSPLEISDLHLATFLRVKYHLKIIDTFKQGKRVTFIFEIGNLDSRDLLQSFYTGNDTVSAREFVSELRNMKSFVYNS